jgi:hypothetical protein
LLPPYLLIFLLDFMTCVQDWHAMLLALMLQSTDSRVCGGLSLVVVVLLLLCCWALHQQNNQQQQQSKHTYKRRE